jgi:site-specific recombinase XerD
MDAPSLGSVIHDFFAGYLALQRGVRPATLRSYRDGLRLFLRFLAQSRRRKITQLAVEDLTFEAVLAFLRHLEEERGNRPSTRNQRLAALHAFFDYLAERIPETLHTAERVAAIRPKRTPPPEPHHLQRDQIGALFSSLPEGRPNAQRDRALLLFLYNTGARAQEASDLRVAHVELGRRPAVRLHGKGDKWRECPLWAETAHQLRELLRSQGTEHRPDAPVFASRNRGALTRFGIYKIVRRHAAPLDGPPLGPRARKVTPHVFRHTTAVHLLESGVEINVVRAWLGHASLTSTHRYAEIPARLKEAALRLCEAPFESDPPRQVPRQPRWQSDEALLAWLDSL